MMVVCDDARTVTQERIVNPTEKFKMSYDSTWTHEYSSYKQQFRKY